ncbi:MAG: diguanylate cyclase [Abyssibacter sp.]|uniref:putative bifunctional diguanylate cyclase/phosphodiesterase n=1 Tax=Abyssibacter sp. TaxID=2320200 RepID=UPI00321A2B37
MSLPTIDLLLVEDSKLDARLIEERLHVASPGTVRLRHASTLAHGVEELGRRLPDCILLDLHLPDGAGVENVEAMLEAANGVTLVVMTGLNDESTAMAALKLGAQEYLLKDQYDGETLLRVLRHAIERNRLVRQIDAQREEQYFHASHDVLTGLANRQLFDEQAAQAVKAAARAGSEMAVCYIDLDGFKPVNDTYGHAVGDAVLVEVAQVLRSAVRDSDHVARLGGDEFAVILTDFGRGESARSQAHAIVGRMIRQIRGITEVQGNPVQLGASAGVSVFPDHGQSMEKLLVNADMAMYAAKRAGRGQAVLYSDQMRGAPGTIPQETPPMDVRHALEDQAFTPCFQPIFDGGGQALVGVEALLRWRGDDQGDQYPAEQLILAARRDRVLDEVEALMWELALRDYAGWVADGTAPDFLAVNVAAATLARPAFADAIVQMLEDHAVAATRIQLEMNPDTQVSARAVMPVVVRLRAAGMRVCLQLDDADLPLRELVDCEFDRFKLRRPLLEALLAEASDPAQARRVRAVLAVAHSLDCPVDVCGIQNQEEAGRLLPLYGFAHVQGRLWRAPCHAASFTQWLSAEPLLGGVAT